MKLERSKNAVRNVTFGLINRVVTIIFPFVVRTVFIYTLGAEFLGLNSLFSAVLNVLNLSELGFSSAIVFSMYRPIAEDDERTINALLNYYKLVYRYIGLIILSIGLLLIPLLPRMIHGSYPDSINLTTVYLIYLGNTVLSYFLFAYLGALITAHQREDVISKVNIVISVCMYILQITALLTVTNYYVYILIMPLFTVINNIRTAIIAKKMFPRYRPVGRPSAEMRASIREKIGGLVISRVCSVTRNSFDSIFISMYLGLVETGMYNNYYTVMASVIAGLGIVTSSVTAGVGNSMAMESVEKNYLDMNRLTFVYMWLAGWCMVCLACLYQPFMSIWLGDEYLLPFPNVLLLCAYFFMLKRGDILFVYTQASGIWWQLRYCTIAEAVANILLNWALGKYYGVGGIILATLLSLFVFNFVLGAPIIIKNCFQGKRADEYFLSISVYAGATCLATAVTYWICSLIADGGIAPFILKMLICVIIPNVLYFLLYFKTPYFKDSVPWIVDKLKLGLQKQSGSMKGG